jgi:CRP/FNR family transcriptional regulator, cyclic AMP receptor protein
MSIGLKKVLYFLGVLDDQDIDWIVWNGERRSIAAGVRILEEGQPAEFLFFILSGEFSVTSGRRKTEVARVTAGEVLGEISFVDSRPASASVTATTASVVGAVPVPALDKKLGQDLAFAARFYKSIGVALADRLRAQNLLDVSSGPVTAVADDTEVPPHVLDSISMAGTRFSNMQRRHWGA